MSGHDCSKLSPNPYGYGHEQNEVQDDKAPVLQPPVGETHLLGEADTKLRQTLSGNGDADGGRWDAV